MSIQAINLFPTTVYLKYCELDVEEITKECYDHQTKNTSVHKSNIGGYQGDNFVYDKLTQEILNNIPVLENKPISDVRLDMWVNINKHSNHNAMHNHAPYNGSVLSGVYYVKCPKNSGNINLFDPRYFVTNALDMQYYNDSNMYWFFEPIENMMLIFPSWLHHSVDQNQSDEDRISIAFNIFWKA
jgi:uncharacterized protein (TIGR02466 family)